MSTTITGVSTEGTTLKWGEAASLTKVIDIKSFGDLGGTPNMLETTTMTDSAQTFISGILQNGEIPFTCNFNQTTYAAVKADAGKQLNYELALGDGGDAGVFEWTGEHRIRFLGKDVDNVLEAEVTVAPSSLPKLKSEGAG